MNIGFAVPFPAPPPVMQQKRASEPADEEPKAKKARGSKQKAPECEFCFFPSLLLCECLY